MAFNELSAIKKYPTKTNSRSIFKLGSKMELFNAIFPVPSLLPPKYYNLLKNIFTQKLSA